MLVTGSNDKTIQVWDMESGKCSFLLKSHNWSVTCLEEMPNGILLSGSNDKTIKAWDIVRKKCVQTFKVVRLFSQEKII